MKERLRNNQFILLLDDELSEKLRALASKNDHAPSKQAYILIRDYFKESEKQRWKAKKS